MEFLNDLLNFLMTSLIVLVIMIFRSASLKVLQTAQCGK